MVPFRNLSNFLGFHQLDNEGEDLGFFISCDPGFHWQVQWKNNSVLTSHN